MYIALDAQAGDYGIAPNVKGAVRAVDKFGCKVILVGNENALKQELKNLSRATDDHIQIVNSDAPVAMDIEPAKVARENPNSSIMVCADLVAKGKASALVSAGNSGATMVASLTKLKRIKNISRPAIAVPLPTTKGASVILDAGANIDCKPRHILEFALMGSLYAKHILNIENPSIGILSVGEEESKGNALVKESIPLLKKSGLNFYGPIEGRDISFGKTDVVVCDGFSGNIALKMCEGVSKAVFTIIKSEICKSPLYKAGAFMLKGAFRKVKEKVNPDKYGGAPLLGVNGVCIVCHGASNDTAISNALKEAEKLVKMNTNEAIKKGIENLSDKLEKVAMDEALSHSENVITG